MYLTIGASVRTSLSRTRVSPDTLYSSHRFCTDSLEARPDFVCVTLLLKNTHTLDGETWELSESREVRYIRHSSSLPSARCPAAGHLLDTRCANWLKFSLA